MATLTIGRLARRAGLSVETLRFYERSGLLPEPPRNGAGYRCYILEDVDRLKFIMNRFALAPIFLGLALASACSKPGDVGSGSAADSGASSASKGNCDMQGMDMSKMSAEEHRKMMEDCPGAGSSP